MATVYLCKWIPYGDEGDHRPDAPAGSVWSAMRLDGTHCLVTTEDEVRWPISLGRRPVGRIGRVPPRQAREAIAAIVGDLPPDETIERLMVRIHKRRGGRPERDGKMRLTIGKRVLTEVVDASVDETRGPGR